jgi:hypothetical protein
MVVVGCAACLWWMSSADNFTSKEQLMLMIACWGAFVGLIPPSFLQDEVEGLDPRDALYGGALAIVALIIPLVIIPSLTSTTISAWTDRAVDAQRMNVRENRPAVQESLRDVADYYRQRGVGPAELPQMSFTVLGGAVRGEAVAEGVQRGFQFLSLVVGAIGLAVTGLLMAADRATKR